MGSTQLREFNVTELVKEIFPQILNKVKIKQKDKVPLQCKVNCIVTISKLVRQDSPFLFPLCTFVCTKFIHIPELLPNKQRDQVKQQGLGTWKYIDKRNLCFIKKFLVPF